MGHPTSRGTNEAQGAYGIARGQGGTSRGQSLSPRHCPDSRLLHALPHVWARVHESWVGLQRSSSHNHLTMG